MSLPSEEEVIDLITEHYQTCEGKPTPLAVLKQQYGPSFKFEKLGFGKFSHWLNAHRHLFESEMTMGRTNAAAAKMLIGEEEMLEDVKAFFAKSSLVGHRKQVLTWIRKKYGPGPFAQFGFGTFPEFMERHGISFTEK